MARYIMNDRYENYYSVEDESRDHQGILELTRVDYTSFCGYNPENWKKLEVMLDELEKRFEQTVHEARRVEGRCARSEAELSLLHLHSVIMSLVRWTTYDAITHRIEDYEH